MNLAISNALEKLRAEQLQSSITPAMKVCDKFQTDKDCITSKTDICTEMVVLC